MKLFTDRHLVINQVNWASWKKRDEEVVVVVYFEVIRPPPMPHGLVLPLTLLTAISYFYGSVLTNIIAQT
jgi:hypothetical protein